MAAVQKLDPAPASKNYKGFVAGVFSGIAKLTGESHPSILSSPASLNYLEPVLTKICLPLS
jgi:hypothetical protein